MSFNVRENRSDFHFGETMPGDKGLVAKRILDRWTCSSRIGNGHVPLLAQRAGHTPSHGVWSLAIVAFAMLIDTPYGVANRMVAAEFLRGVESFGPVVRTGHWRPFHFGHRFTDDCRWSIIASTA
jgi:hypothetical protein